VERAIDVVELAIQVCTPPIYVRKEIVHNRQVVEALRIKGAIFVDELDEVPAGATVIFSAHGVSPAVKEEACRRGLRAIDATCPLVTKVHLEAIRFARDGYTIILVGHEGHDEVVGTMGEAPDRVVVVSTPEEAERLHVPCPDKVAYVSQTTLSMDDTREVIEVLRRRFPNLVGPSKDDICYATQNRQVAVKYLAAEVDVVLVIGSANSSNANRLREVAQALGKPAYLINDITEIEPEWLNGASRVGITAGASTPEFLVHEAVRVLRSTATAEVREVSVANETVRFGRPPELEKIARMAAGPHREETVGNGNPVHAGALSRTRNQ